MVEIVFFEVEDENEKEWIQRALPDAVIVSDTLTSHAAETYKDAKIISPFLYSELTQEVLEKLPNVRCIATRSTGYDHIDLAYCKEKGITVCNVPSYGASTVAEHTFALLLALSRKLIPSVEQTRHGDFSLKGLTGFVLSGKTMGVVGAGTIGTSVIRIAQAFGMNVLVCTKHPDPSLTGVAFVSFETLLETADVISFHVPLTDQTKHMLNRENITLCKKGSILVNTARGGLIETAALLEALSQGIFSGVGLDVLEGECGIREERELLTTGFLDHCDLKTQLLDHVLLGRDDVLITPHNAFNSIESLREIIRTTIENIQGFLSGEMVHVVTA